MAPVVDLLPDLERLNLGFNELEGRLPCGLVDSSKHQIQEIDVASNKVRIRHKLLKGGALPWSCYMEQQTIWLYKVGCICLSGMDP